MTDEFEYDVFLSHSSADKPVVRELAQRPCEHPTLNIQHPTLNDSSLRCSALDVGRWMFNPVLFMSANPFASEWLTLERHTKTNRQWRLFRDPANQQRRFISNRIDEANTKDSRLDAQASL